MMWWSRGQTMRSGRSEVWAEADGDQQIGRAGLFEGDHQGDDGRVVGRWLGAGDE